MIKDELIKNNYSILTSNGYFSYENGIKPVINRLNEDINFFKGLVVVDKVVGKASAMLLCLSKVKEVYALVLSKSGEEILNKYGIIYHYDELVECIMNRKGDDMCPMEKAIKDVDNLEDCYKILKEKVNNN